MTTKNLSSQTIEETIEKALEGWVQSILEELNNPYLTEGEKRELEEELLSVL